MSRVTSFLFLSLILLGGCQKTAQTTVSSPPDGEEGKVSQALIDACSLLTKEEIAEVQGSPITGTTGSGDAQGPFAVAQCYFAAAESNRAVSLAVTRANPNSSTKQLVSEYWKEHFGRFRGSQKEDALEKDATKEEDGTHPPKKIDGIGEESFWSTNLVGGSLYFLKGETMVRLSLGGPDDEEKKIAKSKVLAEKIITRL